MSPTPTFRDAHQSLLATRVHTSGLLAVSGHVARLPPELLSIEAWGGATYDVALRFQVTRAFVAEASATGVDIFRLFDALNNVDQMRPAIDAVRETGTALAEVALSSIGDLSDPGENLYTLDYYLKLAEQIVDAGRPRVRDQGHGRPLGPPAPSQGIAHDPRRPGCKP